MGRKRLTGAGGASPVPTADAQNLSAPETSAMQALRMVRAELERPLRVEEDIFARTFVLRSNATAAYIAAHPGCEATMQRHVIRQRAYEMAHSPAVLAKVREYESAAAAATVIDVQAILEADRAIVQGYAFADEITQHIKTCCRYCRGVGHKYQWVDICEYLEALNKAEEENELRRVKKQRELPLPTDEGGYDFNSRNEPSITCPNCEGFGIERTIFADTTKLEGPARAIVKGIKTTNNGIEILMHDVDKAKERLLRAAGAFGDDAASVAGAAARGAAAGSAAGAAAAAAVADKVANMTADEARKAYLALVEG